MSRKNQLNKPTQIHLLSEQLQLKYALAGMGFTLAAENLIGFSNRGIKDDLRLTMIRHYGTTGELHHTALAL